MAAGVSFAPGTLATQAEPVSEQLRPVRWRRGSERGLLRARVLVVADGLAGRLRIDGLGERAEPIAASRIGAGVVAPRGPDFYTLGVIYLACGAGGYVGLVLLEDGRLDLAAALDPEAIRSAGGVGPLAEQTLREARWPIPAGLASLPWKGTPGLTRVADRPAGERCFLLGDAAGYVEPFTGEGMAWGMLSAVAVAPLADAAVNGWQPALAERWGQQLRRLLGPSRRVCRLVTLGLRRPWLAGLAVRLLRVVPGLAGWVVRGINRPVRLG